MASSSNCMITLLFSVLLLLSFFKPMHALPLFNKYTSLQQVFEVNDNIIIIMPKPKSKYHTASCFQDITQEEEDIEDLMLLLEDEEDYDEYDEEEDRGYRTYYSLLDFGNILKDMFSSLFGAYDWSFWDRVSQLLDRDDQFQFYFDA